MKLNTLEDLLQHELSDLYSAEKQIIAALPRMARAAANAELRRNLEIHLDQTRGHVDRLEKIAQGMGASLGGHACKAMEGFVEEGAELIAEEASPDVRDAGLISAAQRIEHYEIAGYGTARSLAARLGFEEAASMLQQTLDEERETDMKLTGLARTMVNEAAAAPGHEQAGGLTRPAAVPHAM